MMKLQFVLLLVLYTRKFQSSESVHCEDVWESPATDAGGTYSCGARIIYTQDQGYTEQEAKILIATEFPDVCGPCGVTDGGTDGGTCDSVWDVPATDEAGTHSCGSRITYMQSEGMNEQNAKNFVACEVPETCGVCKSVGHDCSDAWSSQPRLGGNTPGGSTPGEFVRVMSYNTEFAGYPCCGGNRVAAYGDKVVEVDADVVGVQECQDSQYLARESGPYEVVPNTGPQNYILYNSNKVSVLDSGWMDIPADEYTQRTITWAKFSKNDSEFWLFNTHLPHNHGPAASRNTHAAIAQQLMQKRRDLGAENTPTIITGDCNPFASAGASQGSFESNLVAGGFTLSYVATGQYGGHVALDKIFHSSNWASSNARDHGTGSSDHPAISVDFTLL